MGDRSSAEDELFDYVSGGNWNPSSQYSRSSCLCRVNVSKNDFIPGTALFSFQDRAVISSLQGTSNSRTNGGKIDVRCRFH
jgi:hypothetical protein